MNKFAKVGLSSALFVAVVGIAMPANAGGDGFASWRSDDSFNATGYETFKGAPAPSHEEPVAAPLPVVSRESGRRCYWRLDAGASLSGKPDGDFFYQNAAGGAGTLSQIANIDMEDGAVFDAGVGCAFGNGFRADLVLSLRTQKEISGDPAPDDPIWAPLTSHSLMANFYYDLDFAQIAGITPYVGVGVGVAYHSMDDVTWIDPSGARQQIAGAEQLELAWSVMAGASYQYSDRLTLDVGYRYIDLGDARSERHVIADPTQDAQVLFEDIAAHEIKAGIRVNFHPTAAMVPFK